MMYRKGSESFLVGLAFEFEDSSKDVNILTNQQLDERTDYDTYSYDFDYDKKFIGLQTWFGDNFYGDGYPTVRKASLIYDSITDQEQTVSQFNVNANIPDLQHTIDDISTSDTMSYELILADGSVVYPICTATSNELTVTSQSGRSGTIYDLTYTQQTTILSPIDLILSMSCSSPTYTYISWIESVTVVHLEAVTIQ